MTTVNIDDDPGFQISAANLDGSDWCRFVDMGGAVRLYIVIEPAQRRDRSSEDQVLLKRVDKDKYKRVHRSSTVTKLRKVDIHTA